MATLTKPIEQTREPLFPPPPAGTYIATIIKIEDQFMVQRRKFQSKEIGETDVTRFYFGVVDNQQAFIVTSREMTISGHERSNLFQMLTGILGSAPEYGWDYCALLNAPCQITVAHEKKIRKDGSPYTAINITAFAPAMEAMRAHAPQPAWFTQLLQQQATPQVAAAQPVTPATAPAPAVPPAAAQPAPVVPQPAPPATPVTTPMVQMGPIQNIAGPPISPPNPAAPAPAPQEGETNLLF